MYSRSNDLYCDVHRPRVRLVAELEGDDWGCSVHRFDVGACKGLQCNQTYIQTENSLENADGQVYYECVKQISYKNIIFNAPDGYLYMPAGCHYTTAWDPQYPCFGGQRWNAFATACPETCHYIPTIVRIAKVSHARWCCFVQISQLTLLLLLRALLQEHCSVKPVARCACPAEKPVWDRMLGCSTRATCDEVYGNPVAVLDDVYKPVRQAEPFPYGWDGK